MAQSVSLSSAGTATIILNPVAKTTSVGLTITSGSSNSVVTVEATLGDPTIPGGPSLSWFTISSAAAMTSSNAGNLLYTVLAPIGGVRLNSTTNSSLTSYTLQALQSVTA